jgi:chemotaxis protein CheX
MPRSSVLQPHVADQARLVTEIFQMMAAIAVSPGNAAWPPPEPLIWARVRFCGPWEGAMTLECTLPLAFAFTANFMSLRRPEEVNDDVSDVIGELANTIAGNFKALLPSGSTLSIPTVGLYADGAKANRTSTTLSACIFESEPGPFCVLLEAAGKARAEL